MDEACALESWVAASAETAALLAATTAAAVAAEYGHRAAVRHRDSAAAAAAAAAADAAASSSAAANAATQSSRTNGGGGHTPPESDSTPLLAADYMRGVGEGAAPPRSNYAGGSNSGSADTPTPTPTPSLSLSSAGDADFVSELRARLHVLRGDAGIIIAASEQLHRVTNDLTNLHRLREGQIDLEPKPVRLRRLVAEIAHMHRAMAAVPIKVRVEEGLETAIACEWEGERRGRCYVEGAA